MPLLTSVSVRLSQRSSFEIETASAAQSGRIWFARLFGRRDAQVPNQIVIFLDPTRCDVLVAISTILSSVEITRRSSLDAVLVHVDAAELATRLTTGGDIIDDSLLPAIAVADRFILGNCGNVIPHVEQRIRRTHGPLRFC